MESSELPPPRRDRSPLRNYNTRQQEPKTRACVFCEDTSHKSSDCACVASFDERKRFLVEKKLCFNCASPKHRAAECASKTRCNFCSRKHHTSICPDQQSKGESVMSSVDAEKVIYPVVVVKVGGIECCWILVHLVVMLQPNCWTCWDSGQQRSSLKELRCLWLLPQQEWRFSNRQFHQGLVITS